MLSKKSWNPTETPDHLQVSFKSQLCQHYILM
jgi:hypothetical protein